MTGQTASRSRLSQPERSARMRQKLLEATVQCLDELGYAGTSTTEVVARAGVSRGALAHHFASKTELVAEAAAYLIAKRIRATGELVAKEGQAGGMAARLRLLWSQYERFFGANIEFMVAARTDPVLREAFGRAISRYDFSEAFASDAANEPWLADDPSPVLTRYAMGCFIRGLCLERIVNEDALVEQVFDKFVALMSAALESPTLRSSGVN